MKLIPVKLTQKVGRAVLQTKKQSPHIFFAGGVIGVVGSTILACKATLKLEKTLDEIQEEVKTVRALGDKKVPTLPGNDYTESDYHKDLTYVYVKSAKKLARLYGPAVVVGVASVSALAGSHVQLTRRNAALTATVGLVSKAYEDYRQRVRDELGEEKELDIYQGLREVETKVNGKKEIVKINDASILSPYARVFDETNVNWVPNAEHNRFFIQCQQNYANHKLHARGHVFLNDVYESLGFEPVSNGQLVGWVDNGSEDADGDGYIDFGLYLNERNIKFLSGDDNVIYLDFNVDGIMYDKI